MKLEVNIYRTIRIIICTIACCCLLYGCSDDKEDKPDVVVLTADKTEFFSDGEDGVTFSIKADGIDVSKDAVVVYSSENTPLSQNKFSTNISGDYSFYATYKNVVSTTIKVTAKKRPAQLHFSADTAVIKANGISPVSFTLTADGKDVTNEAQLFFKFGNTETRLESNTFLTEQPGLYTFFGKYDNQTSDSITVTATSIPILLTADSTAVKANGKDFLTLNMTADDNDVTNESKFFGKYDENESELENNTFSTTQPGIYKIFGKYKNWTSDTLTITADSLILTLETNTTVIKANDNDEISFTAKLDGEIVSNGLTIYQKNADQDIALPGTTFKTQTEGQYEFYATYKEFKSGNVTINVTAFKLNLTTNNTEAKTGDIVTFTATADNDSDVSQSVILHITKPDATTETINGNSFTPTVFGKYTIYATYEERTSENIEINVMPSQILLAADKKSIPNTGNDAITFNTSENGKNINNAEFYINSQKIAGNTFSSAERGTYTAYAMFNGIKSNEITFKVTSTTFRKQSVAMEVVATWCGYSSQMMDAFNGIFKQYSDNIQIISFHKPTSNLSSSAINADEILSYYNVTGIPFGKIDLRTSFSRSVSSILDNAEKTKKIYPADAGIAISSHKEGSKINVTLKVKAAVTKQYYVGALIVEDGVVSRQTVFHFSNGIKTDTIFDYNYVHNGVATYIMPGTKAYSGKSLGTIQANREVTESFTVSTAASVTKKRTIDYSKCRVVAYIMEDLGGGAMCINNAATCPINGAVDYQYEE